MNNPLAQARAPPLGNCASGSVNLLPFLTTKITIMVCLRLLSMTVFVCPCAVCCLTRLHLCLFAYHPQPKSVVSIWQCTSHLSYCLLLSIQSYWYLILPSTQRCAHLCLSPNSYRFALAAISFATHL